MFCVKCGTEYEGEICPNCGTAAPEKRYCPKCGTVIDDPSVTTCAKCGAYVPVNEKQPPKVTVPASESATTAQPTIVINNTNTNVNENKNIAAVAGAILAKARNKWVAFLLCLFLGWMGAHKFYEGKIGMGILYLFTFGLIGIGWFVDCIIILFKPNPYYV